jgi:branched-subunit amino acid ABC-type transport system permease component
VVTWGISLILTQGMLLLLGPFMPPIQIPGGSVSVGQYSFSDYWLVMIALAAVVVAALWWGYNRTTFGLQARATMQNAAMARALGVNTDRVYMLTFGLGAGLAGFSGALLAPTTSIAPYMGQQFVAPAFITVVVGGATNVITGALGSSLMLSLVRTPVGFLFGAFLGLVALLLAALIIIRLMPDGISAWLQKRLDQRARAV